MANLDDSMIHGDANASSMHDKDKYRENPENKRELPADE